MSYFKTIAVVSAAMLAASCGNDEPERAKIDAQVTETRMDDIDQIDGTINDDMIDTDSSRLDAPLAKDDSGSSPEAAEDVDTAE